MVVLISLGLGLLGVLTLRGVFRQKAQDDESRLINAHWLSYKDRFHLISRWGA